MANLSSFYAQWAPRLLGVMRIAAALLFMPHGSQKLFGFPALPSQSSDPVELLSLMGVAGVLELFGGLLLLVGLFTRPLAFGLSGLRRPRTS